MKKVIFIIVILIAVGTGVFFLKDKILPTKSDPKKTAYVEKVSDITYTGENSDLFNYFSGVVETQDEWKAKKENADAKIEIKVKAGDSVKKGDVIFSYSIDDFKLKLRNAEIELERLEYELKNAKETKDQLEKAKDNVMIVDNNNNYDLEIKEEELNIKEKELDIKTKKEEIKHLKEQMKNTDVVSEIDGIVKSVKNESDSSDEYSFSESEDSDAVVVITRLGDYRIKGTVNEQNVVQLSEGQQVNIFARNEDRKWSGTISKIETEKKENESDGEESFGTESTGSTSYPFYVTIDDTDGLMLGQHVYIKVNNGENDASQTGIWLPEYYIAFDDDGNAFLWIDDNGKLAKKSITLGEHDDSTMEYQITEGLSDKDAIAVPDERYHEGMTTAPMAEMPENLDEELSDEDIDTDIMDDSMQNEEDIDEEGWGEDEEFDDEEYSEEGFSSEEYEDIADEVEVSEDNAFGSIP